MTRAERIASFFALTSLPFILNACGEAINNNKTILTGFPDIKGLGQNDLDNPILSPDKRAALTVRQSFINASQNKAIFDLELGQTQPPEGSQLPINRQKSVFSILSQETGIDEKTIEESVQEKNIDPLFQIAGKDGILNFVGISFENTEDPDKPYIFMFVEFANPDSPQERIWSEVGFINKNIYETSPGVYYIESYSPTTSLGQPIKTMIFPTASQSFGKISFVNDDNKSEIQMGDKHIAFEPEIGNMTDGGWIFSPNADQAPTSTPDSAFTSTPPPTVIVPASTAIETSTPLPPAVTMAELGITDLNSDLAKAFKGIEKFAQKEADGRYSVNIEGVKYFLQAGWNLHADLNNAYAPATVNSVDQNGNQVMLIWNQEGLSVYSPLSVDHDNPTKFDNNSRWTTFHRYLLQTPDPFTERTKGSAVLTEMTEGGRVTFLRTDIIGGINNSRSSNVWLEYTAPNGDKYLVNPTDINDINDRKVVMCAYPNDVDRVNLDGYILHPEGVKSIVWPILKADQSFFEKFQIYLNQPFINAKYLFNLLTQPGYQPEKSPLFSPIIARDFYDPELKDVGDSFYVPLFDNVSQDPVDKELNGMVIPCVVR